MENQQQEQKLTFWEKNRMLIKGLIIGILILLMLIPAAMLSNLVTERQERQAEVVRNISDKWASDQTVTGPVIKLPYLTKTNSDATEAHYIYLLPENLKINGNVLPEVRHRSLYNVTLYKSDLTLSGNFNSSAIQKLGIAPENILWNDAQLVVQINDIRGLEENINASWDTVHTQLETGQPDNAIFRNPLSAKVAVVPQKDIPFSISMKLKGSSQLYFTPVGKTTEVSLTSPWKDPAFDGQYLPSPVASVSNKGFQANWKILQVSRGYPQAWVSGQNYDVKASAFGVKLLQPNDNYGKTDRSIKYAILIISLTFTIFFFVELFQKKQIHPLQYVLVGMALCIFYSLLLSISEYVGFNAAYLIAATATVSLIAMYVLGIFKKLKIVAGFGAALGSLYTYIYILIQLQDYALLAGSVGLFVILAIIMFFSKKVDWYHISKPTTTGNAQA